MRKIKSKDDASCIVTAAINSHWDSWQLIDRVEDVIIRALPPYDEEELKKAGVDWANNWGYGEGKMLIERTVASGSKDVLSSLALLDLSFKKKTPDKDEKHLAFLKDDELKLMFARIISTAFIEALFEDPRLFTYLANIEYNSLCWGWSIVTHDEFSYLGNVVHKRNIAFEDRTKIFDIKTWVTFDTLKASFLLEKEKSSDNWRSEEIKKVLVAHLGEAIKEEKQDQHFVPQWNNVEEMKNDKGEIWIDHNSENIHIAKVYQYIEGELTESYVELSGKDKNAVSGELIYQRTQKITRPEVFNIVREFAVSKSDFINDIDGVGLLVAEASQRFDKQKNSVNDKLLLSGSYSIRENGAMTGETKAITVAGGYIFVGDGVEMMPDQVQLNLQQHVQNIQSERADFSRNIAHYSPQLELSSRPTKDEVRTRSSEVSSLRGTKAPVKLSDYSGLFTRVFHNLCKSNTGEWDKEIRESFFDALEDRMERYGLDRNQIRSICGLVKNITLRPVVTDVNAIKEALRVAGNAESRRYLLTCYMLALGFSIKEIHLILSIKEESRHAAEVAFENAAFYNTSEVVFYNSQDHILHLDMHFAKIDRVFQGVTKGEDPIAGFNYVSNAMINCQKHILAVDSSPFFSDRADQYVEYYKIFEDRLGILSNEIKKMKAQAAEGSQQQKGIDPEVLAKIELKQLESSEKIRRTNEAHQQRSAQRDASFQQMMKIKEAQAMNGAAMSAAQQKSQIEMMELQQVLNA